jgi:hypothetical protein
MVHILGLHDFGATIHTVKGGRGTSNAVYITVPYSYFALMEYIPAFKHVFVSEK